MRAGSRKMVSALFLQEHSGDGPGDDRNDEKEEQAAFRAVIAGRRDEGMGHIQPVPVEVADEGRQGAHVQEDIEAQAAAGDVKVMFQEGQMGGTGDGQKFADALDYAE